MQQEPAAEDRFVSSGRMILSVILCAAALFFAYRTIGWRWMHDESIMHYVNFLMDHGKVPYKDIVDLNMPGSYFIDGWAIRLFGTGDLGWRFYEFSLLACLTTSMIVIAWPYDWFAGLFAGVLFVLAHAFEGPDDAAQRDEIMTVLVMFGYAMLFLALRMRRPILMLPFGVLLGLAASLKPTAVPLGIVLISMAAFEVRRRREAMGSYLGIGLAGLLGGYCVTLGFLLQKHAFGAFLGLIGRLVPYYAGLGHMSYMTLAPTLFSVRALIVLLPIAIILTIVNTDWKNWERWALALGICFGLLSYFSQRKGFHYHRYPFLAFVFLWIGLEFVRAVQKKGWVRVFGATGILLGVLYVVPVYALRLNAKPSTIDLPDTLERDLTSLGVAKLQNQVQCMDLVSGCLNALYRLDLVQYSGYIGDYMFFPPRGVSASQYDHRVLQDAFSAAPPKVIVVTSQWLGEDNSFDKIDQWSQFASYLNIHYSLSIARNFGPRDYMVNYRIYVLKGAF